MLYIKITKVHLKAISSLMFEYFGRNDTNYYHRCLARHLAFLNEKNCFTKSLNFIISNSCWKIQTSCQFAKFRFLDLEIANDFETQNWIL